jgi:hypothetical protein
VVGEVKNDRPGRASDRSIAEQIADYIANHPSPIGDNLSSLSANP